MSQILTNALATYKAQQEAAGQPVILDQIVFAYVPGIDPEAPIDPDSTLPPEEQIVYRYDIPSQNIGFINPDAVVYSCLLGTDIGTWTYNSIYLINSELNLAGSIITTPDQVKVAADPTSGIEGDTLVRNIVTTYANAQELTQITVAAEVWQLDFTLRLAAMDERVRQINLDEYGHASFFEDGWKVTHTAGATSATINPGVGYVGGLKSVLASMYTLDLTGITLPKTVYVVSTFQGQANSAWETTSETRVETSLAETFTENGYTYYAAPLALLSSSADADDLRQMNKETDFVKKDQFASEDEHGIIKIIKTEEIAQEDEDLANDSKVLTLFKLLKRKATETLIGLSRFAIKDEAVAGTSTSTMLNPKTGLDLVKSRISDSYTGKRSDYAVSEKAIDSALYAQTPLTAKNLIKEDLNDLNSKEHAGFYHQSTNSNTVGNNYPVELAGALMVQKTVLGSTDSVVQTYFEWSKARQFKRAFVSGTWTDWAEVYSQSSKPTPSEIGALASQSGAVGGQDWDALTVAGTYIISNATGANFPEGAPNYGSLFVQKNADTFTQMYVPDTEGQLYIRFKWANNAWRPWHSFYSTGNPQDFVEVAGTVKDTFLGKTRMDYTEIKSHQFYSDAPTGRVVFAKPGSVGLPSTTINGYMIKIGARDTQGGSSWLLVTDSSATISKFYYGVTATNDSSPKWVELYSSTNPPKVDEISGLEHIGKTAVGVSVQANDVAGDSYQEFYDYGGDFFDLVSFDPSTYETHIYESGYYLVDVIVMRGEAVSTAVGGINVALKVNDVQYSDGFVAKEDATKRNPISLKVVLKLNAGDKVRVYSDQDAEWQAGGSITFQYLRPLDATKTTKDK